MVEGTTQTNNVGEMRAVILAIKIAYRKCITHLEIRTDSKYTIQIAERIHEYKTKGWKTKTKRDLKNKSDIIDLYNTLNTKTTYIERLSLIHI